MIHQQAKSALGEVVMVALQQISAQLIHHDDDHEFGLRVIGAGERGDGPKAEYDQGNGATKLAGHTRLV